MTEHAALNVTDPLFLAKRSLSNAVQGMIRQMRLLDPEANAAEVTGEVFSEAAKAAAEVAGEYIGFGLLYALEGMSPEPFTTGQIASCANTLKAIADARQAVEEAAKPKIVRPGLIMPGQN